MCTILANLIRGHELIVSTPSCFAHGEFVFGRVWMCTTVVMFLVCILAVIGLIGECVEAVRSCGFCCVAAWFMYGYRFSAALVTTVGCMLYNITCSLAVMANEGSPARLADVEQTGSTSKMACAQPCQT